MSSRPRFLPWLSLVASALGALAAPVPAMAADPVVAVLYFDNNTGAREMDVLQKGFADMMVTDLSAVSGVTVVERAKLQALLDEMKLQKSEYFDARTAVKVGRGLGASHVVTGAFAAFDPSLRIDVRLVEIGTSRVLVADKVVGPKSQLFELEQTLVGKFVAGLKKTLAQGGMPKTKVQELETLLEYSRGLDLADRGQFQEASEAMARVIKAAPIFSLARLRRDEFKRQLEEARARRQEAITEQGLTLAANAEAFLEGNDLRELEEKPAGIYLAYRVVRGWYQLRLLRPHVAGRDSTKVIRKGHRGPALKQLRAYVANTQRLLAEWEIYAERFTKTLPDGQSYLNADLDLPREDEERAKASDFEPSFPRSRFRIELTLARMILLGRIPDASKKQRMTVGPTLADLDPAMAKLGYGLFDKIEQEAYARAKEESRFENDVEQVIDAYGEALILRGRVEEAVERWQRFLDTFPTSRRYAYVERSIKQQLGLAHDHTVDVLNRYRQGLATCAKDMDLRVGLGTVLHRRTRMAGLDGIDQVVEEVNDACRGKAMKGGKHFWPYLYMTAALAAARFEDCDRWWRYVEEYTELGGSKSDLRGYLKNHVPHCKRDGD